MMSPDPLVGLTYGLAVFYKYMQDQFDFNNQVIRRTVEILTAETLGPLLKENNVPDTVSVSAVNVDGGSAALNRALEELFNLNIQDVWADFSISLALMRNNKAIPSQWRHYWPYWIFNRQYAGYPIIFNDLVNNQDVPMGQFADWWEKFETNQFIPGNYGLPAAYVGQTFVRTLPALFEAQATDLKNFIFNVTYGTQNINVTIIAGEWRISLLQFMSDGSDTGSFVIDGPYEIGVGGAVSFTDLLNPNRAPGPFVAGSNIRLVLTHVSFSGTGLVLSDYFTTALLTGSIRVTSA